MQGYTDPVGVDFVAYGCDGFALFEQRLPSSGFENRYWQRFAQDLSFDYTNRVENRPHSIWWLNILADSGEDISRESKILDFGCGSGENVADLIGQGFDATGTDFSFKRGDHVDFLKRQRHIFLIEKDPYRLPFRDNSFDVIVSFQVMEHVKDYPEALCEIRRVLRPGGRCLHMFPSRLRVVESHVGVPFASLCHSFWYLWLWAKLGLGSSDQIRLSAEDRARDNQEYLKNQVKYHSGKQIREFFVASGFYSFVYAEKSFLRNSPNQRGRRLARVGTVFPLIFLLYRTFWARVLIAS